MTISSRYRRERLTLLISKHPLHQPLESTWGITQSERHSIELEESEWSTKSSLGADLTPKLALGYTHWPDQWLRTSGHHRGNQGSPQCVAGGKASFLGLTVEKAIIYAQAQTAVLLTDQNNGRGIRATALPNDLCFEELVDVSFYSFVLRGGGYGGISASQGHHPKVECHGT